MTDIQIYDKVQRITKRIIAGCVPKYEPEKHIAMLVEVLVEGNDVASFCAKAEIARSTFYEWINKYAELSIAYEVARELSRDWWERQPLENGGLVELDGIKFNTKLWCVMMKNRFEMTDQRKLSLPKLSGLQNFNEQINVLIEYAANGGLTSQELSQLSNLILAGIKVDDHVDVKNRLEKLEAEAAL